MADQLILLNTHTNALSFELQYMTAKTSPSMRRAVANAATPVYLERNGQLDVCAHLRLSLAEAERVVAASPIVRLLESRGHLLRIVASPGLLDAPVTTTAVDANADQMITTVSYSATVDYDSWTHKQLMTAAKERSIKLPKNPRKAWLVAALQIRDEGIWQADNQK